MTPAITPHDLYLLACVAGTVLLLLLLIGKLRLHASLGLALGALTLGLASGMPARQVPISFSTGVGNMMGHIVIVLGMGAILGRLLAASGGAASLGRLLVDSCGPKGVPWAMLGLGILVGMPVFLEVGLVLLLPIVAETARRGGRPAILTGLPLLAGLSIVHGVLPPHPAAMLAAATYHADLGRTILDGLAAGIPAAAIAGPGLAWLLTRRWLKRAAVVGPEAAGFGSGTFVPLDMEEAHDAKGDPRPAGPVLAAAAILLPIALICLGSWADALAAAGSGANTVLHFVGSPDIALILAAVVALFTLGSRIPTRGRHFGEMLRTLTADAFGPIAGVIMILSAAGGLSGVLRDSGAAQATVGIALAAHMPALVLAWLLAAVIRISMGSATVALAVASGVLAPIAGHAGVRPELLVLATGTGSLILSHVNDSGFWLVTSFFKLEMKETLGTWTVMETVLSVAGLGTTLLLAAVLQ